MKPAVAYLRISKNESRSVSLDYQKAEVERVAIVHDYQIIDVQIDNGTSGKAMANRAGIQNVMNMVNSKSVHAVICYKSDRISRNGIESIMFESLLNSKNVVYLSVSEGIIGDINEDPLMPWLRGGLNQRERLIISMRTKAALNRKRERGERLGGGIRYGQSILNGNVVENTSEIAIVTRIKQLNSLGYPTRKIAEIVNSEGFKPRRGQYFRQTQIIRILRAVA